MRDDDDSTRTRVHRSRRSHPGVIAVHQRLPIGSVVDDLTVPIEVRVA